MPEESLTYVSKVIDNFRDTLGEVAMIVLAKEGWWPQHDAPVLKYLEPPYWWHCRVTDFEEKQRCSYDLVEVRCQLHPNVA